MRILITALAFALSLSTAGIAHAEPDRIAHRGACAGDGPPTFPTPDAVAALPDSCFPMPARRRATLRELGAHWADDPQVCVPERLAALHGVGPWTAAMVALRGWSNPDAFPLGDLGLRQAWEALGGDPGELGARAERWRPYRGYAANLLWRSLG